MLSNDFTENDVLQKEDIRAYVVHEEGTVERVEIDAFGMKKMAFDEAIKRLNQVSDTLFDILT